MSFIDLPYDDDAASILDGMLADYQGRGYTVRLASPEVTTFAVVAEVAADAGTLLKQLADRVWRRSIGDLYDVPQDDGVAAETTTVWAFDAASPTVVSAGTRVGFRTADGRLVRFITTADLTVPVGASSATSVSVRALIPGVAANGLPVGALELIDDRGSVLSVTSEAATAGGVDPESDVDYSDRLVEHLRLSWSRAVLPPDFAVVAAAQPSVHRAVAIDLYDPSQTPPTGRPGHVSAATVDVDGRALSPDNAAAVEAELVRRRGVNVTPHVIGPTFTPVAVTFSFVPVAGRDGNVVRAAAEQRVRTLIDPATFAGGDERPPVWRDLTVVRLGDVIAVVEGTDGLDHTVTGTVKLNGAAADLPIVGPAGLPAPDDAAQPSTVVGTVAN